MKSTLTGILGLAFHNVESSIGTRANTPLEIEIVAVADYSVFDELVKYVSSFTLSSIGHILVCD
jgi:hypothetical protein